MKFQHKPRTLDDKFMRDGLCAVSVLDDKEKSKGLFLVVGGSAVQGYLPSVCRRPTSDIDLSVLVPLNYEDFKEFSKPSIEYLRDNGYETNTSKGSSAYNLSFFKGDDDAVIEFSRRNQANIEKKEKNLVREVKNSRRKIIEGRNLSYPVASPEDIVVPKLVRGVGSLLRNVDFFEYLEIETKGLTDEDIIQKLKDIAELRDEAILHAGDPSIAERVRFVSDIYDIRMLSEIVGFNESYLADVINSWNSFKENPGIAKVLFEGLLPKLK